MPIKPEFVYEESRVYKEGLGGLPPGALLIPEEVAAIFETTVGRLADDRNSGTGIPFIKHGGDVRYKKEHIDDFIDGHTFTNTAQAKAHAIAERATLTSRRGRKLGLLASSFTDFISGPPKSDRTWLFTFTGRDEVPEEFFSTIGKSRPEDPRERLTKADYLDEIERATQQRETREDKERDLDPLVAQLLAKAPSKPSGGI